MYLKLILFQFFKNITLEKTNYKKMLRIFFIIKFVICFIILRNFPIRI